MANSSQSASDLRFHSLREPLAVSQSQKRTSALHSIGWSVKRESGCPKTLQPAGYQDHVFAFHDGKEIGPRMLSRIAKHTGLEPGDLGCSRLSDLSSESGRPHIAADQVTWSQPWRTLWKRPRNQPNIGSVSPTKASFFPRKRISA